MKNLKYIIGFCLLAVSAFALVKQVKFDEVNSPNPQYFSSGLYVGKRADATPVTSSTLNKETRSVGCTCNCDSQIIQPRYAASINCSGGPANGCTCAGVKLGDPCMVGMLQASTTPDAGSSMIIGAVVTAVARANDIIEIDVYNALGDGGNLDLFDAGYNVRCISNQ